jgi:hypothetical protein
MYDFTSQNKHKTQKINWLKTTIWIVVSIILLFVITIPWRRYVFNKNISQGDDFLAQQKYTEAYVEYQKAGLLQVDDQKAGDRLKLAKDSASNVLVLQQFLQCNNYSDLLKLIDDANSKVCNLAADRALINNNLPEVAKINLEFCANSGPRDDQSWLFLGLADLKLADSDHEFSDLKPGFRQQAANAFAKAYTANPLNKTAIVDSISIEKTIGDRTKVDYWQNLLDNLNKISQ